MLGIEVRAVEDTPSRGEHREALGRSNEDMERVRALTGTELDGSVNRRSEGFWNAEVSGVLRVVNNTATCVEPALAIYRDELPAEVRAGWSPLPTDWVDSDGYVRFCVSKGTLVPAASLRGGKLYLGPQKRQRLGPQAAFAPHATLAFSSSVERQSDDGASDSEPFAASRVDSPSHESVYHLDVMAVPVQLPAMRAPQSVENCVMAESPRTLAEPPPHPWREQTGAWGWPGALHTPETARRAPAGV